MLCELIEIHAVYLFLNVLSKNLKHELNYIYLIRFFVLLLVFNNNIFCTTYFTFSFSFIINQVCTHSHLQTCNRSSRMKLNVSPLSPGYHAPLDLFPEFHRIAKDPALHAVPEGRPVSVCVGKEWHRFPSSFLLPNKSVSITSTCNKVWKVCSAFVR